MRSRTLTLLAVLATLPVALPAAAEGYRSYGYYGTGIPRMAYGRGFAEPFVAGEYIGAPFTHVPSPNRIVPAPWSYGTYGVPTVSGIAAPPTGAPTLTVIHAPGARKSARREGDAGDVRVVNVNVPRR